MYDIWEILTLIIFFSLPVGIVSFFIISLVKFLKTPKDNVGLRKKRKNLFIVSSVIFALFGLTIAAFGIILMLAVANM